MSPFLFNLPFEIRRTHTFTVSVQHAARKKDSYNINISSCTLLNIDINKHCFVFYVYKQARKRFAFLWGVSCRCAQGTAETRRRGNATSTRYTRTYSTARYTLHGTMLASRSTARAFGKKNAARSSLFLLSKSMKNSEATCVSRTTRRDAEMGERGVVLVTNARQRY